MYRMIGGDGREYGPVSEEQLRLWIAQRRADASTRVKTDDGADWVPLGERAEFAAEFAPPPPPLPAGDAGPSPWPGAGAPSETVPALPRATMPPPLPGADAALAPATAGETPAPTAEAFAPPPPSDPRDAQTYIENCLGRTYRVEIGDAVSRGYDIVAKQLWLALVAVLAVTGLHLLIGSLPVVGGVSHVLAGVFEGGLLFFFLAVARSGRATFGDAFAGFRFQFRQLAMFSVLRGVAVLSAVVFAVVPVTMALGLGALLQQQANVAPATLLLFVLALPVLLLPALYLVVSWSFAPFLIVDRGLGFWDAMELSRRVVAKRWFKLAALHLAFVPIHFAGLLTFGVGLLYTLALEHATFTAVYEDALRE